MLKVKIRNTDEGFGCIKSSNAYWAENAEVKQLVVNQVVQLCQSKNEADVSEIINAFESACMDQVGETR